MGDISLKYKGAVFSEKGLINWGTPEYVDEVNPKLLAYIDILYKMYSKNWRWDNSVDRDAFVVVDTQYALWTGRS